MPVSNKIKCFEYIVLKLIDWHKEKNPEANVSSNFSKLKVMKLLFFVSSVKANDDNMGLLDIFDNFWAMPFGHVESDIYNSLSETKAVSISSSKISINQVDKNYFSEIYEHTDIIDDSLKSLKLINSDLINYEPFDLVELSHKWESWITIYSLAKQQGKQSLKIPTSLIQKEPKSFSLN